MIDFNFADANFWLRAFLVLLLASWILSFVYFIIGQRIVKAILKSNRAPFIHIAHWIWGDWVQEWARGESEADEEP